MSFVRPGAARALHRWREVLIAAAVAALGLWLALGHGFLVWVGGALVVTGLGLAVVALQRLRFGAGRGGPGVVRVVEGQIAYFGPLTGGAVAQSELRLLRLDPTAKPAHWVLEQDGQPPLFIPLNAEGADALFDVFAALPGLSSTGLLARMRAPGDHPVVIWRRAGSRPDLRRLH